MGTSLRQKGGRTVRVKQLVPHPSYSPSGQGSDVSLLRLAQRAVLGKNVRVVSLSRRGAPDPAPGSLLVISGWGNTRPVGTPLPLRDGPARPARPPSLSGADTGRDTLQFGSLLGQQTNKLQRAQVQVVERGNCSAEYDELGLGPIMQDELCAGGKQADACQEQGSARTTHSLTQGDSGGPMVDLGGVQVGIVSWGAGCATYPGVYTKVGHAKIRDFIRKTASV
ncbi:Trypsin-1 [Frankliniella fusca]|uniref:Trypsin-1 n=1 Tax=Frankliniella fusca TaxID=407009 RepID=A0AAE1LAN0_9NEOP|nr:Trypsin-1 [Frankliniella fusca]